MIGVSYPVTCGHSRYHTGLRPPLHAAAGAHATVTLGGFGMHRFAKGVDPGMVRALALRLTPALNPSPSPHPHPSPSPRPKPHPYPHPSPHPHPDQDTEAKLRALGPALRGDMLDVGSAGYPPLATPTPEPRPEPEPNPDPSPEPNLTLALSLTLPLALTLARCARGWATRAPNPTPSPRPRQVCTGLGYTSIAAAREARVPSVTT